jgi:hypothetical protein
MYFDRLDLDQSTDSGIMPTLFGEVEVNIKILELLIQKLDPRHRQMFINTLTDDQNVDLHQLFSNIVLSKSFLLIFKN